MWRESHSTAMQGMCAPWYVWWVQAVTQTIWILSHHLRLVVMDGTCCLPHFLIDCTVSPAGDIFIVTSSKSSVCTLSLASQHWVVALIGHAAQHRSLQAAKHVALVRQPCNHFNYFILGKSPCSQNNSLTYRDVPACACLDQSQVHYDKWGNAMWGPFVNCNMYQDYKCILKLICHKWICFFK